MQTSRSGRSATLGLAMALANAASYVFVLLLTRALDPAAFGAYSALNTLAIALVIPAASFQVMVARRWSDDALRTDGRRAAHIVGIALSLSTAALAVPVSGALHLPGLSTTIAMGLMLWPMTLTGALQGVLLGTGRIGHLAGVYLVAAITRLLGGLACLAWHLPLTGVFLVLTLAAWVTAVVGKVVTRDLRTKTRPQSGALVRELLVSNSALAAFTVLTNLDVVLVRHFLDAPTSGGYGLASTFARAMCWGTQFIALLTVPAVATSRAGVPRRAASAVCLVGFVGCVVVALAPTRFAALTGGQAYSDYGWLIVVCLALGTLWSLCQLVLLSNLARGEHISGATTWAAVGMQLVLGWTWLHQSVWQVLGLCATVSLLVLALGLRTASRSAHA